MLKTGKKQVNIARTIGDIPYVEAKSSFSIALDAINPTLKRMEANANATASGIDVNSAKTISYIAVDSNGTQNESVVQDIVFAGASGNVSLSATRSLMRYQSNGTAWEWQATTAY